MRAKVKAATYNYNNANLTSSTSRHSATTPALNAQHLASYATQSNPRYYFPSATPQAQEHSSQTPDASTPNISPNPDQVRKEEKHAAPPNSALHLPGCETTPPESTQAQSSSHLPHAPTAAPSTNIAAPTAESYTRSEIHSPLLHMTTGKAQNPTYPTIQNFLPKTGPLAQHQVKLCHNPFQTPPAHAPPPGSPQQNYNSAHKAVTPRQNRTIRTNAPSYTPT